MRRWIPRIAGFAIVAALGGFWFQGRAERHLAEAERQLAAEDWDAALAWLELPTRTAATRERAALVRARLALALGRPSDAVAPLESIQADGPLAAESAYWKGRALHAVGNTPLAVVWFRTALAARPDDPESLRWLAAAAYDLGDRRTLLDALRVLTRVKPKDAPAWRTLALVTLEEPDGGEREYDQARRAYERSLRLDPAQPTVRLELAGVLIKQGDLDAAARQLEASAGRVPEADRAALLAEVAWERGDLRECLAVIQHGLKSAVSHPALLARRGLVEQREGRGEEALRWLDRAVAADPFDSRWYHSRAIILRLLGKSAESERDARRGRELRQAVVTLSDLNAEAAAKPLDADTRIRAGQFCESLGKPALAASWYRAALACDPRSPIARAALQALGGVDPAPNLANSRTTP